MRADVTLYGDEPYIQFVLKAGNADKIIAIDDISIVFGACDDIDDRAFPAAGGPSVCSVDKRTAGGKINMFPT